MSRTTLCLLTAAGLALLSVGLMVGRYRVLGNEVKLPGGPGTWKVTLVVCGSEFGRTPVREVGGNGAGRKAGRDHNPFGFTMWLAGGAVKGGTIYGATDDFGFKAVENPVSEKAMFAEADIPF